MKILTCGILPIVAGVLLSGCASHHEMVRTEPVTTTTTRTVVVNEPPPPDRVEVESSSPGTTHAWIQGYWMRIDKRWVWVPGHWEMRPREGAQWVAGHWDKDPAGEGWIWREGHWQ